MIRLSSPALQRVYSLLREGFTPKEIAALRGRSHQTVKNQASTIYAELGVSGFLELQDRQRLAELTDTSTAANAADQTKEGQS